MASKTCETESLESSKSSKKGAPFGQVWIALWCGYKVPSDDSSYLSSARLTSEFEQSATWHSPIRQDLHKSHLTKFAIRHRRTEPAYHLW